MSPDVRAFFEAGGGYGGGPKRKAEENTDKKSRHEKVLVLENRVNELKASMVRDIPPPNMAELASVMLAMESKTVQNFVDEMTQEDIVGLSECLQSKVSEHTMPKMMKFMHKDWVNGKGWVSKLFVSSLSR
jgi:hypothetical protein